MTVSIWQRDVERAEVTHQDLVLGAGLVGAWTATVLRDRGRDVALIDASLPASGASGRNGGFVLTAQRDPYPQLVARVGRPAAREVLQLLRRNVAKMRRLADDHGVALGPPPARLAEDEAGRAELEAWARLLEEDGVDVELSHRDPFGSGFHACMRVADDAVTQPALLTTRIARASGATFYGDDEVFALATEGAGVVAEGRRTTFRGERAWICLNGYAGGLSPWLAARVFPKRGQMFVTPPSRAQLPHAGISRGGYFRPLADGRVAIGGARAHFAAQESTLEDATTPNLQARLLAHLRRWLPDVEARVEHGWAGIQGFTSDRRVIVGSLPGQPAIAFAVGFSGYGNGIGLLAAERMVEHALDGAPLGVLSAYRPTVRAHAADV